MGLLRWFTRNWANTQGPSHWDLAPLVLPVPPDDAREQARAVAAALPGWQVAGDADGVLHLTRRTRVWGFVEDIRLRFLPAGPGCLIHAESRSRFGFGDLGQNRRNILELWDAIRAAK